MRLARKLLVVALIVWSPTGFAQLADRPLDQIVAELQNEVQEVTLRDGPSAIASIDPLTELGSVLQRNGDHIPAVAIMRRAQAAVRRNYGLDALEQVPLIFQLIESERALGRHEVVWDLEQELLGLARRNPGDMRAAHIFSEMAGRRLDVLNRYNAGEWPPEIYLGCYYGFRSIVETRATNCRSGTRGSVRRRLSMEAHSYYIQSINIILENEQYGSSELPSLLTDLLHSSFRFGNPTLGERSLRFILAYQDSNSEPASRLIDTLTQLADWKLLYSRSGNVNESALRLYEQVYESTVNMKLAQAKPDRFFSPEVPIVLPAFIPNPLVTERTLATRGHIDVAFDVTRYGRGKRIDILDMHDGATRADKRELVRLILRSRFRPRVEDGQFADASRVALRYYVNDQ